MTQEEIIIAMALEAGIETDWSFDFKIRLERFAALIAAHEREKLMNVAIFSKWYQELDAAVLAEREACAKVCDVLVSYSERQRDDPTIGKYVEGFGDGSISCAAAIRARSELRGEENV